LRSKNQLKTLSSTLEESKKNSNGLNQTISQINNGQGTLGKLMQDKSLYNNLEKLQKTSIYFFKILD
jgi:phospholipid/cholesterol/gamma-HCH transport system substrate-binding protein